MELPEADLTSVSVNGLPLSEFPYPGADVSMPGFIASFGDIEVDWAAIEPAPVSYQARVKQNDSIWWRSVDNESTHVSIDESEVSLREDGSVSFDVRARYEDEDGAIAYVASPSWRFTPGVNGVFNVTLNDLGETFKLVLSGNARELFGCAVIDSSIFTTCSPQYINLSNGKVGFVLGSSSIDLGTGLGGESLGEGGLIEGSFFEIQFQSPISGSLITGDEEVIGTVALDITPPEPITPFTETDIAGKTFVKKAINDTGDVAGVDVAIISFSADGSVSIEESSSFERPSLKLTGIWQISIDGLLNLSLEPSGEIGLAKEGELDELSPEFISLQKVAIEDEGLIVRSPDGQTERWINLIPLSSNDLAGKTLGMQQLFYGEPVSSILSFTAEGGVTILDVGGLEETEIGRVGTWTVNNDGSLSLNFGEDEEDITTTIYQYSGIPGFGEIVISEGELREGRLIGVGTPVTDVSSLLGQRLTWLEADNDFEEAAVRFSFGSILFDIVTGGMAVETETDFQQYVWTGTEWQAFTETSVVLANGAWISDAEAYEVVDLEEGSELVVANPFDNEGLVDYYGHRRLSFIEADISGQPISQVTPHEWGPFTGGDVTFATGSKRYFAKITTLNDEYRLDCDADGSCKTVSLWDESAGELVEQTDLVNLLSSEEDKLIGFAQKDGYHYSVKLVVGDDASQGQITIYRQEPDAAPEVVVFDEFSFHLDFPGWTLDTVDGIPIIKITGLQQWLDEDDGELIFSLYNGLVTRGERTRAGQQELLTFINDTARDTVNTVLTDNGLAPLPEADLVVD